MSSDPLVVDTVPHACPLCEALGKEIHLLRLEIARLRASNKNIWNMAAAFSKAAKRKQHELARRR